ncbi:MAG TPA: ABC transporter substrate-binding protein, partial [Solirubrobacterales bacterium]|nr:ABC transporter substrate-binding protein [Solirubrobacterales bacterium]
MGLSPTGCVSPRDQGGESMRLPNRSVVERRTAIPVLIVAMAIFAALALSACGGGSSSSSSTESTTAGEEPASGGEATKAAAGEEAATGEPIKTMFITPLQSQATPTYQDGEAAAVAFEKWTNAHGGIGGRPIKITICDERGEPTQAAACARQAVQENDVAVVGSFTFFGESIVPILEKAHVALFGGCCAESAAELESPISFPLGSQPAYGAAAVAKAFEEGCETMNAVIVEGAEAVFEPVMENAAKVYGKKINKFVTIPAAAKDESAVVAEALSGDPECVATIFGESLYKAWMGPWAQSGTSAVMYGAQGNLNEQALEGFEEAGDGSIIAGVYANYKTPPWQEYREALEFAEVDPSLDYGSLSAQGAWSGGVGFKVVAESI